MVDRRQIMRDVIKEVANKKGSNKWNDLSEADKNTIIRRMERSCYNEAINECKKNGATITWDNQLFLRFYSTYTYDLTSNISLSTYLLDGIIEGILDANNVGSMTPEQMNPDANKSLRDFIEKRKNTVGEKVVSHRYQCRKCFHWETVQQEYGSRGSDESTRISIKCCSCGATWRKG